MAWNALRSGRRAAILTGVLTLGVMALATVFLTRHGPLPIAPLQQAAIFVTSGLLIVAGVAAGRAPQALNLAAVVAVVHAFLVWPLAVVVPPLAILGVVATVVTVAAAVSTR